MKIAVTGATGFIGQHVLVQLARFPVEVTAITRQTQPDLPKLPNVRTVQLDLRDASPDSFGITGNPDVLIHLAWDGLTDYKSRHHMEQELPMHYRFLHFMVEAGLHSVFASGTCFEYGMQSGPLNEDMETLPENSYGLAKDTLRRQLEDLQETSPFVLTWGRLFYLFGDGQSERSLQPQLKRAVARGDTVFNMSGGEQIRDYLPVKTAAEYIVQLAMKQENMGVVNICSGRPVSVCKLVQSWIREIDYSIRLNPGYYPYPDYEPMSFWGDRQKLDRCLGHHE